MAVGGLLGGVRGEAEIGDKGADFVERQAGVEGVGENLAGVGVFALGVGLESPRPKAAPHPGRCADGVAPLRMQ